MAKPKRMDQIQTILLNYLSSGSIKATARRLKISKNTVREYVRRAQAHYPDLSKILELNEAELYKALQAP